MSQPNGPPASPRVASVVSAVALSAAFLLVGPSRCTTAQYCLTDDGCESPRVCNAKGACVFECSADADCNAAFSAEYVCEEHRCAYPLACTLCVFDNAEPVCVHGVCMRGACRLGFHDVNGDNDDGCEYECTRSHGGIEACDGLDNDCDSETDEDFDLASDPDNCGACDNVCPTPPHADRVCASGDCVYNCHPGWYDNNNLAEDGCEDEECVPGDEVCDGHDNDCNCPGDTNDDGVVCGPGDTGVDEGFDKTLPESCGPFCAVCAYDHADALCVAAECAMGDCDLDWWDIDKTEATGCEYPCTVTGDEICDEVDNDCDGEINEGAACACPPDMVLVADIYCIDRYEASRSDATDTDQGVEDGMALSQKDVLPWMVNPVTADQLATFSAACAAADKRLCTKDEWFMACTAPEENTYVYGDTFDREACNCVDTYCDDYCEENGIPPGECSTSLNCGYTYDCFHVDPTGLFPTCTNKYGHFDINGNVWEVVPSADDDRGFEIRGGAFNCASPDQRVTCGFNAGWEALYAGFRCCKDAE